MLFKDKLLTSSETKKLRFLNVRNTIPKYWTPIFIHPLFENKKSIIEFQSDLFLFQTSDTTSEKWGVKEGVKMMVTSSLLSVSQPHTQKALTVAQNSTDTGSPTSSSSSTSRISASAVASALPAVAVARTVAKDVDM